MKIKYTNIYTYLTPENQKDLAKIEEAASKLVYPTYKFDPKTKRRIKVYKSLVLYSAGQGHYYFLSGLWPLVFNEPYPSIHKDLILPKEKWPKEFFTALRDYQIEAIQELLKQPRGIIHATTGAGKTFMLVWLCKLFKPDIPILIIIPKSQALLEQVIERFLKDKDLAKEVGWNYGKGTKEGRIIISSPGCLDRLNMNFFPVILCDEVHAAPSKTIYTALMRAKKSIIRYGFSGTPFGRSDEKDLITLGLFGNIIKEIKYNELSNQNYVAKVKYIVYSFKSEYLLDPEIAVLKSTNDWNEIANNYFLNKTRKKLIKDLVEWGIKKQRKILIIVERKKHGQVIEEMLSNAKVKFVCSETRNVKQEIEKFKHNKYQVLIATSLIETGIDIPDIDMLILGGIGKSYIQLFQRIGRGLRPKEGRELLVFDLVDFSHGILIHHAKKRIEYVQKEGFPLVKKHIKAL